MDWIAKFWRKSYFFDPFDIVNWARIYCNVVYAMFYISNIFKGKRKRWINVDTQYPTFITHIISFTKSK